MNTLQVQFAHNAVAISWKDEAARDLVYLLFGAATADPNVAPRAHFRLSSDRQTGEISLAQESTPQEIKGTPGQIAVRLLDQVSNNLADRCRGGLLFRAACLGQNGQVWLFPGAANSGKSSLAVWLAAQGFAYCSDEMAFLPLGSRSVQGFTRAIFLKLPALDLFPELDHEEWLPVEPGGGFPGGAIIPPDWAGAPCPQEPLSLARILFPHYQPGASYAMQPLAKADAALELSRLLVNARNLPNHGFPEVMQLVRSVPAYNLIYSSFGQIQVEDFSAPRE